MLQEVKKSRASRFVVAAAIVAMGAVSVTATPTFAADDQARDPNGLYIFGQNPWDLLIFPIKMISRLVVLPLGGFRISDDYEAQ